MIDVTTRDMHSLFTMYIAESAVKRELLKRNLDSAKMQNLVDEYPKNEKTVNKSGIKIKRAVGLPGETAAVRLINGVIVIPQAPA